MIGYQADNMAFNDAMDYLEHHGVLGMKWGVRNEDTLRKYAGPKGREKTKKKEKVLTGVGYGLLGASVIGRYAAMGLGKIDPMIGIATYQISALLGVPAIVAINAGNTTRSKTAKAFLNSGVSLISVGDAIYNTTLNPVIVSDGMGYLSLEYLHKKIDLPNLPWQSGSSAGNTLDLTELGRLSTLTGMAAAAAGGIKSKIDYHKSPASKYEQAKRVYDTKAYIDEEAKRHYDKAKRHYDKAKKLEDSKSDVDNSGNKYYENAAEAYLKEHPNTKYSKAELMSKFKNGWN